MSHKKLKQMAAAVSAVVLAGSMTACSSAPQPSSQAAKDAAKPADSSKPANSSNQKVTVRFWYPGADQASNDYFANAVKEFEKLHPNITVESTVLPANPPDIDTKLNAAKLSGTYPDVFSAYLIFMGTRGYKDEFAPLDDYMKSWSDKDDLFDSAISMGKVKGKTVGLGFYPAPEILTYRKDLFKAAGLDPEKPPTNWSELAADAEKLTKRDANGNVTMAGLDIPGVNGSVFMEPFLRQNGSKIVDEEKGVPAFNDAASIAGLKFITDLVAKKVSIPYNYQKKDEVPFMNGHAAMSFLQTTMITGLVANKPELKDQLGFAPVLKQVDKVAFNGYRLFTMGAGSKVKDESWELIKFMMSKDQMWKRYTELKIPIVRKSLEKQFTDADPKFNAVLLDYIQNGKGKPTVPWSSLYDKYITQAYEEAVGDKKPASQALTEAQAGLEKEIAIMGSK